MFAIFITDITKHQIIIDYYFLENPQKGLDTFFSVSSDKMLHCCRWAEETADQKFSTREFGCSALLSTTRTFRSLQVWVWDDVSLSYERSDQKPKRLLLDLLNVSTVILNYLPFKARMLSIFYWTNVTACIQAIWKNRELRLFNNLSPPSPL